VDLFAQDVDILVFVHLLIEGGVECITDGDLQWPVE
jgi:hypothetical protein